MGIEGIHPQITLAKAEINVIMVVERRCLRRHGRGMRPTRWITDGTDIVE